MHAEDPLKLMAFKRLRFLFFVALPVWLCTLSLAATPSNSRNLSGALSSSESGSSSTSFPMPTTTTEFHTTRSPSTGSVLSTGAWAGIGVAAGVVLIAVVVGIACMLAKCWRCCCFASSSGVPAAASTSRSARGVVESGLSSYPSFSSTPSSLSSQASSMLGDHTHSQGSTKSLSETPSKVSSADSGETAESTQSAFLHFAVVSSSLAVSPALEASTSRSQHTVAHQMGSLVPAPNPFSPASVNTTGRAPVSHSSRTPSPYRWTATPDTPPPQTAQQLPLPRTERMQVFSGPRRPLRRRSSSVSFVDISD